MELGVLALITAVVFHIGTCGRSMEKGHSSLSFTHHFYNATIYENSAPKTYIQSSVKMGIKVLDSSWNIRYKLVSGDDDGLFATEVWTVGDFSFLRIRTQSGNAAMLNREVKDSYTLTIEAVEDTYHFQARTKVSVRVLDTNDLKPLFFPASYYVDIKEDAPLRTSVVRVSATDADLGSNAEFYYYLTQRSNPFAVDPFTGVLTLARKLNHSLVQRYDLAVFAEDRTKKISGTRQFGNVARIVVNVEKVPVKHPHIKSISDPKDDDDDSVLVDIYVEDGEKEVDTLKIVAGDPHMNFEVIPSQMGDYNFQIVSTTRIYSPHNPHGLNLSLQAYDSSSPPLLSPIKNLLIPPFDKKPFMFEKEVYYTSISEFAPLKSHVVRLAVTPSLSNVTYYLKNSQDSSTFYINSRSGQIVTNGDLDFETKSRYELNVVTNHGGAETKVIVEVIDENDNAPIFTQSSYQDTLPENMPIGSSILTVYATDNDIGKNGLVTYAIASAIPLPFVVDPFTGVISTTEELDYELMKRWYHLRIWATDSGLPFSHVSESTVTLVMSNINDNVPMFESVACNATVPLDLGVGKTIGTMSAVDLDELEQIRYRMEAGNEHGLFAVEPVSGAITLVKKIHPALFASDITLFNLSVTATDGKHTSDPTLVRLALTAPGTKVTFHCEETGIFKQLTERLIKSIKPDMYIQEEDSFSDVHIINSHIPKFNSGLPSSIDIREDFPLNTTILHFQATDDDTGFNSKLVYAISNGNEDGCFTIDINTGELKLFCPLDRETKGFYILNVTVYDLGTPQKSVWKFLALNILDANDNPPEFEKGRYVIRIAENSEIDKSIFQIHAVDKDLDDNSNVKYSLLSSAEIFSVDELTGVVKVIGRLDRETRLRHDLRIEARDQPKTDPPLLSITELVVVLEDINDNPPKFMPQVYKIQVPEDFPVGTVLLWIEAFDFDLGAGGEVNYNLKTSENGTFSLDTTTGSLILEKELDFERKQSYNLTVRAVDRGKPRVLSSSCIVEVMVLDVNENLNAPTFSKFVYNGTVKEDAAVGTSILKLSATDPDRGKDGVVKFHIHDGTGLGVFSVDEETGVIRTTDILDREAVGHYWLTVSATDQGTISLMSWTDIYIEVLDVNDNLPELSQLVYFGSVLENSAKDSIVLQVEATDADSISDGQLTFEILETQRTYFNINSKTGVIRTVAALDREQKAEHTIEVTVSDNGSPALLSTATVVIKVLDENDNSPQFSHKLFQVKMPERKHTDEPQEIYRMLARDNDEGVNAAVTYSLEDDLVQFAIHPMTGVVSTTGDFRAGNYSIISIKATDHGNPARSSTARLDIEWLPEPLPTTEVLAFDESLFTFVIMETDPVTQMVGIISTEITLSLLWFDIIDGEDILDFDIEKNSGSLMIARRLDASRRSNYNLTVRVSDGVKAITTQAFIRVLDINEHRPQFLESKYEVSVPEDTLPWKRILQISATDKDTTQQLIYTIHNSINPVSLSHFHLDHKSGILTLIEALDFETLVEHTLIVMVRDQEIPVKRNFVKVIVYVEDCNDHSPSFVSTHYISSILSEAPIGTEVLKVNALDRDKGSNAEIMYTFHSGNTDATFSIDAQTGTILVAKSLENLPQEQYNLNVKATDQGFPQKSDICPVSIHVKPSMKTPPKFSSSEFFTEISESSAKGTPFFTVAASSPSTVQYRIKDGNPNGTFYINPFSGLLVVQKELDFEACTSYRLQIRATTPAGVSADAVVYVYVIDENDNLPAFIQDEFVGQISESAPINSMVMGENNTPLVVRATDSDFSGNGLVVYQIIEPEMQKLFRVDPSMGTISIISPVDFELTPMFCFSIQVQDSGQPSLFSTKPAKVTIHVLDFNDCPPKFTASTYESVITFPLVSGMEVTQVTANDPDSEILYSINEGNSLNIFSIDATTGVISVNNASNLQANYQLFVKASDGLYKDTAVVRINVSNITQTSLGFEKILYVGIVTENITSTQTVVVVRASGSYLNEPLIYSVLNPGGMFKMVPTSGVLETTGVSFDREEKDEYNLIVKVKDMRYPPRVAIAHVKVYVNDVNDNTPQFINEPYFVTIAEDADPGDVLFQVTAVDQDLSENGSVIYLLEDDFNLFRIDPYLGDVSLQRPLDFESLNRYDLRILARDEGEPSLMSVAELNIQVKNRSNPIFQRALYSLKIPENILPLTTILHVQARNPEGHRLIYNMVEENATKTFLLDFKTGILSVANILDYETQSSYSLTVRATDSVTGTFSEAIVKIEVEDQNDNAPVFFNLSYTAQLPEGVPIGSVVMQISATDRDSGRNRDLLYELIGTENNETQYFAIDAVSGVLVTTQVLDYEQIQQFHLKVRVTDNGVPPLSAEAFVLINVTDINDNPPNFSNSLYQTSLSEMATCGNIVIKVQASDPDSMDNDNLEYKILSGNEDRKFAINTSSGLISFSNVCRKSVNPFYNLTVAVSDGVFQKTAPVNIDMINSNRYSPQFEKSIYEAELAENSESGTRVIRLAAIDPDDGPYGSVDYTIINKLADEKFSIDNKGQIRTSQPLDRENPTQRVIAIKVMAKDGGGKVAFCTVKIILTDENDNAPQFQASEYQVSIQSSVNKGSPVIQIMAYDADDGHNADVTYVVDEGEEVTEDVIEINPFTGLVSVKESLVGLENKILNFNVKARDGGVPFYNATVPVKVKVVPPEVPLPQFTEPLYTFSASEDLPIGSEIGTVKAYSEAPIIYSLVDGNTVESNKEGIFAVGRDSGTLIVHKNIDHEKTKWYQIDVMAQCDNNGTKEASLVSVKIQVQDVNDNQPVFEANPYQAFLAENMPLGTTVIQVTANDPDMESNGKVTYRLEPEPDDSREWFTIDSETGWITTLKEMDSETKSLYQFHVVATDHGGSIKLSSSVLVEVAIMDENDNPPRFTEDTYQVSVMENSGPGEVIATLRTTDKDISEVNRQILCYITDGDFLSQFAIMQVGDEWQLILKGSMDREVKEKYILKITATDGRYQAFTTVEVHVLDINDNSPVCEQLLYTEVVTENSSPGLFILKVSASDPDLGTNGQVTFTLHGPNSDKFHLDPHTGELFTFGVIDREHDVEYDLVARATDGGGRSCQADILLMVQDVNDNAPKFSTSHYSITVFDNTTLRTPIAVVYAKDPDTGINGEVVYSLQGSDSSYFSMDAYSGILRLETALSDEPKKTYELKIQASDRGLPRRLQSVATVTVNVVDLDDYQPVFLSSEYMAQIPESTTLGTQVLSLSAHARDINMPAVYHIISGNEHGMFQIDSRTGVLIVNGSLDFELCREYYLSVEGTRGRTSLSDIAMVIINITDVNDNTPTFSRGDYNVEISEDVSPGASVIQVSADDLDGSFNNQVHYSIVSGDSQQHFTIDSNSGDIRVNHKLDREEVTHYSLTVQATDGGDPPLSSAVQVTVTVVDVNDNPPTFSQINHNLVLQEDEPMGSGILQLTVTDRDTPKNGPPFSYHIVSGNENKHFHVDQGGLLSTMGKLKMRTKSHYLLKIQVTDNGHPPLSSICVVWINISEQSKHPPSVVPLEVYITTVQKGFSRRVIGKLHASDQDAHDVLSYNLVSERPTAGHFSVDRADGSVVVERPLETGQYTLNVSVSDGRSAAWGTVRIHVWGASQQELEQGVTLKLAGLSAEEFVSERWRALQASLSTELGVPRQELHLASVQSSAGSVPTVDVLLVHRRAGDHLSSWLLDRAIYSAADAMGIDVLQLQQATRHSACRNTVRLLRDAESNYKTHRASIITPRHTWETICTCNNSAIYFDGWGYLKYVPPEHKTQSFRLSLRLKTSQRHGTVVTAEDGQWGTLELLNNGLQFRYSCIAEPPGILQAKAESLFDGRWHQVELEVNNTGLSLAVDGISTVSHSAPVQCLPSFWRGTLLLAGSQAPADGQDQGFVGCMDHIEVNGEVVRSTEATPGDKWVFGRYQCCPQTEECDEPCVRSNDACRDTGEQTETQCNCPPLCHPVGLPDEWKPGMLEAVEIGAAVLGLVFLVAMFLCVRRHFVKRRKHKAVATKEPTEVKTRKVDGTPMELSHLGRSGNNLDHEHDPFCSLKPRSQRDPGGNRTHKAAGPVVCSVAPNLPAPPSSNSDNESIMKNNWEMDYDVYPADPDYYGRPTVQEFPQFDIVENTYHPPVAVDPRRASRFGGFPFPLDRCDRRAPLPPCYSNQNLDDFLGPDGLPLPTPQCPNEYTAISYFPTQHTRSMDNVSAGSGYQRLSVRLSVAQPSYAEFPAQTQTPSTHTPRTREGSDMVESDYGSCEEVMF